VPEHARYAATQAARATARAIGRAGEAGKVVAAGRYPRLTAGRGLQPLVLDRDQELMWDVHDVFLCHRRVIGGPFALTTNGF
jgi:hypothetical protein